MRALSSRSSSSAAATKRRVPASWPVSARRPRVSPIRATTQASTATIDDGPYARLAGVSVARASNGSTLLLRDSWAAADGERALLVLARSFGCPFCQATAREIARDLLPSLDKANVRLVFVGIGTPERAKDFAARTGLPQKNLFADAENAAHSALRLESSFAAAFLSPQTPLALAKRAAGNGGLKDLQAMLQGWEAWQPPKGVRQALNQGGAFLFDGEECMWSHRDPATGAHAEPSEMLSRALGLAAKAGAGDCGCDEASNEAAAAGRA
jgi:peroxiredoxin